jgi:hypothetical protein
MPTEMKKDQRDSLPNVFTEIKLGRVVVEEENK